MFCILNTFAHRIPTSHERFMDIILFLQHPEVSGMYQWCGKEVMTKYDMVLQMADVFQLSHEHIQPADADEPGTSTTRPFDTQMDTSRLEALNIGTHTVFKQGIKSCLESWVPKQK